MTIRLKTILGIALIELFLLIILIGSVLRYMNQTNTDSLLDYAQTTSNLFATAIKDAILSDDLASLESFVNEILKNKAIIFVKILNDEDALLAKGGSKTYLSKPFVPDKNVEDVKDKTFKVQKQIVEGQVVYGKIQMGISTAKLEKSLEEVRLVCMIIGLIEMCLVALFSFILGTYLTRQLKHLQTAAKAVSQGDLAHQIQVKGKDELAEVTRSFNKMIKSLAISKKKNEEYQVTLHEMNQGLEDKVQKRTKELVDKNKELEKAYTKLQKTKNKLVQSEKMASVGQLAAGVAHEINNPLGYVLGNLNMLETYILDYQELLSKYRVIQPGMDAAKLEAELQSIEEKVKEIDLDYLNEDIQELLKEFTHGAKRIGEIVSALKTFSHNDETMMDNVSVQDCIDTALKIASNQIKNNCVIEKDYENIPQITGNDNKLIRAFVNLIVNAGQAIEEKGTIKISSYSNDNEIQVSIEDTGKGIPQDQLSKVFDPFFTTRPVGEGTGLGLAICQNIIEEHGGDIAVESTVEHGTKFTITFKRDTS